MLDQMLVIVSVTFLVMLMPGPDMVLVLRNTLVSGRRAGLQSSIGILSGNLVHITYCVLGIGLLISRSILAFSALKYAAAVSRHVVSRLSCVAPVAPGTAEARRPDPRAASRRPNLRDTPANSRTIRRA